ncbi:hypothetical protein [Puniceibacterium sp. IMCC21224]|uniref:hypothetical protein n=1 Tax=Puniceibacterium sp. IMCC21224 TaxID=1618204 RepID=UPI00064DE745|nr:hypothetical protein [Puniceibacterium sp. IMCC21224]KMK67635.1 hypothetical protein IMCC21224_112507 [Puniceibacterium sp. IMCC21224]
MSFVTELADELANDTLKAMDDTGEDRLYVEVAKVLAASSTTLEEAFVTAIRVRLAERRARVYLNDFIKTGKAGDLPG